MSDVETGERTFHNFRGLGGLVSGSGLRFREGLLYRSDDFFNGGGLGQPGGGPPFVAARVIDLRNDSERDRRGMPSFVGPSTLVVRADLLGDTAGQLTDRLRRDEDLTALYLELLDDRADLLSGVLRELATDVRGATVVYCVAGKDRTGVVVALLLSLLGMPDDVIVEDYARSRAYIRSLVQSGSLRSVLSTVAFPPVLSAAPSTMAAFLRELARRRQDGHDPVAAVGLDAAVVDGLHHRYLEPS